MKVRDIACKQSFAKYHKISPRGAQLAKAITTTRGNRYNT